MQFQFFLSFLLPSKKVRLEKGLCSPPWTFWINPRKKKWKALWQGKQIHLFIYLFSSLVITLEQVAYLTFVTFGIQEPKDMIHSGYFLHFFWFCTSELVSCCLQTSVRPTVVKVSAELPPSFSLQTCLVLKEKQRLHLPSTGKTCNTKILLFIHWLPSACLEMQETGRSHCLCKEDSSTGCEHTFFSHLWSYADAMRIKFKTAPPKF